jgi:hypothetical protein
MSGGFYWCVSRVLDQYQSLCKNTGSIGALEEVKAIFATIANHELAKSYFADDGNREKIKMILERTLQAMKLTALEHVISSFNQAIECNKNRKKIDKNNVQKIAACKAFFEYIREYCSFSLRHFSVCKWRFYDCIDFYFGECGNEQSTEVNRTMPTDEVYKFYKIMAYLSFI